MEGQAEVATKNKTDPKGGYLNGTLAYLLRDPRTAAKFAPTWDNRTNTWTVIDNIKVWYNEIGKNDGVNGSVIPSKPGDATFGSLSVGYGSLGNPNLIGPEYGFGFGIRDSLAKDQKVLIVKTAWGGKTLAGDFRPPSSVANPDPFCTGDCPNQVGHYYKVMLQDVAAIMKPGVIADMFPDTAGLTPTIAGFGWFQGWNDGCSLNQTAAYESNMVNLIKDVRVAWDEPGLPVVIAASGFGGFHNEAATRTPKLDTPWVDMSPADKVRTNCANDRGCRRLDIVLSQFAAANATRHPELHGKVITMETRHFWRDRQYSPNHGQGYHFWHNAETYYLIGEAMAKGMLQVME